MLRLALACTLVLAAAAPAAAAPKAAPRKPATAAKKPTVVAKNTTVAPAPAPAAVAASIDPAPAPAAAACPTKLDPLEAALAQAEAHAAAPRVTAAPAPAAKVDLSKLAHDSARVGLDRDRGKKRDLPSAEMAIQMEARTIDQKTVAQTIRADMRALQYCYESLIARGVKCGGDISLNFTIEPRGNVSAVKVSAGGVNAPKLEACVAARVKAWKFPSADAPTDVAYPLVFETNATVK